MNRETIRVLVRGLTDNDSRIRDAVRLQLLREDEAVVADLIDEFWAGVNTSTGNELLEIIGQIGGYEAIGLFQELAADPGANAAWRAAAVKWLRRDGFIDDTRDGVNGFESHQ